MAIMPSQERRAYTARLIPYLTASLGLFFLGFAAGLIIVQQVPELADRFADTIAAFVKGFAGMPRWQLALAIFLNNSIKTLIALLLGILLGIVPGVFLLANGVALGVALSLSIQTRGLWHSLASVVPHGIIELPAVFLGMSIGLLLGVHSIGRLRRRAETPLNAEVSLAVRYFFAVILPLLLLAALVEAFITAALVMPR